MRCDQLVGTCWNLLSCSPSGCIRACYCDADAERVLQEMNTLVDKVVREALVSYTCYCMDGYTGNQCSTNWDECWSSPCGNGATCVDGVATFNCSCPPGFTGLTCEEDVDECQSNPCFNNGVCQDGVNGYSCTCLPGYQGVLCEVDIAVCNMTGVSLCINGGVCIEGPGDTFSCACLQGWTGQICETAVDECVSSPCQNGGVCVDLFAGYSCACPFGMLAFFTCKSGFSPGPKVRPFCVVTGYTGSNCEVKLHPCLVSPCLNQALCLVEAGTRVCYCVPDYHGDRCQFQYDECQLGPRCLNGGTCLDGVDNYTCSCPPDLTGSLCECLIMGPGLLDCSYISPTPLSLMSETVTDQTSSTVGPVTWQHTLVYDNITLTSGWTSVGQSEAATSTTTPAGGFTTNYPETSTDTSSQQVTEETVSGLSSQLLTGTISSPRSSEDSTQTFVETESAVTPRVTSDTSGGTEGYFTSRHQPRVSTEGVYDEITTLETSGTTQIFGLPGTTQTSGLPGTTHTSELPGTTQASELPGTTQTSELPGTTQTSESPTTTQTDELSGATQTDEFSGTTQTGELPGTTQTSELSGPTPECPETEYTSGTAITAITYPSSTEISSTTDVGSSSESVFYSTSTEEQSVDCSVFPCQNSGTCVYTKGGPRYTTPNKLKLNTAARSKPSRECLWKAIVSLSCENNPYFSRWCRYACAVTPRLRDRLVQKGLNWLPVVVRNLGGRVEIKILKSPVDLVVRDASPTYERTKEYESDYPHVGICRRPVTRFIQGCPVSYDSIVHLDEMGKTVLTTAQLPFGPCSDLEYINDLGPQTTNQDPTETDGSDVVLNDYTCCRLCTCKFGWEGPVCEEPAGIREPAFTGQSYLSHRLYNGSEVRVEVLARTLAPTGLILYASLPGEKYLCLFLQEGLLQFQFSCGLQTMLFSEVQMNVNNGYHMSVLVQLVLLPGAGDTRRCHASLRINNTLVMSGEQTSAVTLSLEDPSGGMLHLAGVPPHLAQDLVIPRIVGFTGCMKGLKVSNRSRHIFKDAVDGQGVSECSSLACLSNPCYSAATCVEYRDHWHCLCPSGYVGVRCEQSVCSNNPCMFGATCVVFTASGFLCLCPLGKHGVYCQHDVDVAQPQFWSSVGGLSSYAAYQLPGTIHNSLELKLRFSPTTMDQIALLVFVGQEGVHTAQSDHLALSFIKGYLVLTWNLGSGPRRIFTPRPVTPRANRPHTVRLGRVGQTAWLLVDNLGNVSGRSPGRLSQLNTRSVLYLGGHESANFSQLPHDLPLHTGFSGCLFDVELRAGRVSVALQRTRAAIGRSVGQCGTSECHQHACHNGGACLHHGATFTVISLLWGHSFYQGHILVVGPLFQPGSYPCCGASLFARVLSLLWGHSFYQGHIPVVGPLFLPRVISLLWGHSFYQGHIPVVGPLFLPGSYPCCGATLSARVISLLWGHSFYQGHIPFVGPLFLPGSYPCYPCYCKSVCLCPEGWFGPLCSQRYNPCDSNRHKCKGGATCVPLNEGYHCDCPLGKAGTYCDKDEQLSDVSFSGQRSYLSLPPATLNTHQACVDLEVRPLSDRGLVLFAAKEDSKSFMSLSLQGGVMELRVSPGRSRRRGEPLVVRSGRVLALGEWHRVVAGRYGRRFYLRVDGTVNSGALLPGETLPSLGAPLQLGGLEDLSRLPASAVSGLPVYFSGCLRQLAINWRRVPLNTGHILRARNVADCDGTACGGDVCDNGGSCWLDKEQRPRCVCLQMYTGARCETQISCAQTSCLNDGRCVEESGFVSRCHCPVGWGGAFCQDSKQHNYVCKCLPRSNSDRQHNYVCKCLPRSNSDRQHNYVCKCLPRSNSDRQHNYVCKCLPRSNSDRQHNYVCKCLPRSNSDRQHNYVCKCLPRSNSDRQHNYVCKCLPRSNSDRQHNYVCKCLPRSNSDRQHNYVCKCLPRSNSDRQHNYVCKCLPRSNSDRQHNYVCKCLPRSNSDRQHNYVCKCLPRSNSDRQHNYVCKCLPRSNSDRQHNYVCKCLPRSNSDRQHNYVCKCLPRSNSDRQHNYVCKCLPRSNSDRQHNYVCKCLPRSNSDRQHNYVCKCLPRSNSDRQHNYVCKCLPRSNSDRQHNYVYVNVSAPHFRGNSYLRVERGAPRPTREREQLITGVDISYIFLNLSTVEPDGMILWTSQNFTKLDNPFLIFANHTV
uniref:Protein eyes shut homolog n=1 Tax=Timema douglasi TaxID=61478 RepID=A0A7R8VBV2_TIMDO|nr:unnamed protein product [Timema douglasi]